MCRVPATNVWLSELSLAVEDGPSQPLWQVRRQRRRQRRSLRVLALTVFLLPRDDAVKVSNRRLEKGYICSWHMRPAVKNSPLFNYLKRIGLLHHFSLFYMAALADLPGLSHSRYLGLTQRLRIFGTLGLSRLAGAALLVSALVIGQRSRALIARSILPPYSKGDFVN